MRHLLVASKNLGKIKEIKDILSGVPFEIKTLINIGLNMDVEESGKTFEENAILKAKTIGEKTGLLTLADDSGLEVDVLGGRPGIYSSRYTEGTDLDRIYKLLNELRGIPITKRTARFKSVVVIYNPTDKKLSLFEGECKGRIIEKPKGNNGFGYDPVFYSFDLHKTFGEGNDEEKNIVSHRGRALGKCKKYLGFLS